MKLVVDDNLSIEVFKTDDATEYVIDVMYDKEYYSAIVYEKERGSQTKIIQTKNKL